MAKIELKQPIVEEIRNELQDAKSAVLVDYRGLTVEQDTRLRRQLREAGITYKVYKNTMVRFAIEGTEYEALKNDLEGPNAIAVSKTDATAPARILADFAKEAEALEIRCGIVEGTYYDQAGIRMISKIPAREELLSKLLGSLQSPITNLARVLKQIAEAKEKEPAGETAEAKAEEPAGETVEAKTEEPAGETAEAKAEEPAGETAEAKTEEPAGETAEAKAEESASDDSEA